jgi:hypothetical protein
MVYLDRACTKPFPLDIPSRDIAKYHLIVVAHGSEARCIAEFGGSGSLMFFSSLGFNGDNEELSSTPFAVGDLDRSKTFIHVLTESTVDILLGTLDTISDFVWYLEKKEKFVRSMMSVTVPGEEELLAYYLGHINSESMHDFVIEGNFNAMALEEGFWEDFCKSSQRLDQIRQNEISYAWDDLIERFSSHALNATQYFTNHLELSDTVKGIIDMFTNTPPGTKRTKCLLPLSSEEPFYVFLCLPRPNYASYEEYREVRGTLLETCLMVVKYKFPEAVDIVGIASEPLQPDFHSSEDLLYLDAREWSDELDAEAAKLQKELNILTSPTISYAKEKDYPG